VLNISRPVLGTDHILNTCHSMVGQPSVAGLQLDVKLHRYILDKNR
jgi:hypothetical protein